MMLRLAISGFSAAVLVLGTGLAAVAREPDPPATLAASPPQAVPDDRDPEIPPVLVTVLDAETDHPIEAFSYSYRIETPGRCAAHPIWGVTTGLPDEWRSFASPVGTFSIDAPRSCRILLGIRARDYISGHGYPSHQAHVISSRDVERRLVVKLRPGATVLGVVKDEASGVPIARSRVYPVIFASPGSSEDRSRAVETDERGQFELRGVDPFWGVSAFHPDYLQAGISLRSEDVETDEDGRYIVELGLRRGDTIRGIVRDPSGQAIPDVRVRDPEGKEVRTGVEGRFELRGTRSWYASGARGLWFEKEGLVAGSPASASKNADEWSFVLKPCPRVMGQVLGADGQPVRSFKIAAGPGEEPDGWESNFAEVNDEQGRFLMAVRESDRIWLGAKAPGHAVWEAFLEKVQVGGSTTIRLERGTFCQGAIIAPADQGGSLTVRLVPELVTGDSEDHQGGLELSSRQSFGMLEATVRDHGAFRLDHVRPGRYRLHVFGPGITPINQVVVVPDKGLDLGRLTAQGTGSIFGRVSSPPPREGKPWPFAGLVVWFTDFLAVLGQEHLWPIGCRADENGEFRIDGVPVGWVSVLVPYEVSADSSDAYVRKARVLEGQVTEVRFFDPERAWDVAFEFTVGDGSEAHWLSGAAMGRGPRVRDGAPASLRVDYELSPLGNEPVSFIGSARDRLVQRGVIVAPDTHPGKYRVRFDCDGLLEPFYEAVIDVTPYMDVVDVHLPAGSITGRIEAAHQRAKRARVFAVSGHGGGYVRRGACDAFADFFLAFLPPDDYTVYAWDPEHGWCRFGPISIADNRVDVGERQLAGGGTIQGSLPETSGRSCDLYVTDASGVEIFVEDSVDLDAREFVVRHLWPGEWVLTLRDGKQTVATASAALQGTETVYVDLRRE